MLKHIVEVLRSFKGITRKASIGPILKTLNHLDLDDAGYIELDHHSNLYVVVSADGIVEDLVRADPQLAGYYSVLVNVNDVLAKGARPIGYVNIISSPDEKRRRLIAEGIKEGLAKYRIRMLKGHTHPDTTYDSIDAAVVGLARTIVRSSTAEPGDAVMILVDLNGKFGAKNWIKSFDATRSSSEENLSKINAVISILESGLITASRDVSSPGIVGCLAMLCESSKVGASINLGLIPKPDNISLLDWLTAYMSMGFILTSRNPSGVAALASRAGLVAEAIGEITDDKRIVLKLGDEKECFVDLSKESVFGLM